MLVTGGNQLVQFRDRRPSRNVKGPGGSNGPMRRANQPLGTLFVPGGERLRGNRDTGLPPSHGLPPPSPGRESQAGADGAAGALPPGTPPSGAKAPAVPESAQMRDAPAQPDPAPATPPDGTPSNETSSNGTAPSNGTPPNEAPAPASQASSGLPRRTPGESRWGPGSPPRRPPARFSQPPASAAAAPRKSAELEPSGRAPESPRAQEPA